MTSTSEDAKFMAEAHKAEAEALAAENLAALHLVNATKSVADARKAEAEAAKAEAEAANVIQQNVLVTIAAEQAKRAEQDELAADRHHHLYNFGKSVSEGSVRECINQLTNWSRKDPYCEIEICFNSPGGSIVDGFALFDFIQMLRTMGHKVTTSALGMAASMAGVLLQAGDVRIMGKQSWLMIHEASFGAVGKIGEVEDCVPLDHRVLTADFRWVPAGELYTGQEIVAFDEERQGGGYRKWRKATVTNTNRGIKECFDVVLESGKVIRVSSNHPFLGRGSQSVLKWIKACDLVPGKHSLAKVLDVTEPAEDTWVKGYMAGLLDGDGTASSGRRAGSKLEFGQNDGPVFDWVAKTWANDGFITATYDNLFPFRKVQISGGLRETVRALSLYQPQRVMAKFIQDLDGKAMIKGIEYDGVVSVVPVGEQEVVLLGTSTRTFIGEGYAMHNTVEWVKRVQGRILDIFAERSNMSKTQIRNKWTRKDWWLSSDEALELGFVDELR